MIDDTNLGIIAAEFVDYIQSKQTAPSFLHGYKLHHVATARGYQSIKSCTIYPYNGRFGVGIVIDFYNPRSTYMKNRAYYIENKQVTACK